MHKNIKTFEISDYSALPHAPLVSVYMITYRHENFIAKAISGVIAQQCEFPIELIIGEDCSPDRTREIVQNFQRRYPHMIRVLSADHNVGAFNNAMRCIKAARGKYIAICEGDDFWHHPRKLQMQIEAMSKSNDITLCHTDYDRKVGWITKTRAHQRNSTPRLAQGNAYSDVLLAWTVKTATAVYRADLLREFLSTEFNNPSWPFGDYNKVLYASCRGRIIYLPVSTATWRRVSGSITRSNYDVSLQLGLGYEECREMFMRRYPVEPKIKREVRRESKRRLLRKAFFAGSVDEYDRSHHWLIDNGFPKDVPQHKLRQLIMKTPALLVIAQYADRLGIFDFAAEIVRLAAVGKARKSEKATGI